MKMRREIYKIKRIYQIGVWLTFILALESVIFFLSEFMSFQKAGNSYMAKKSLLISLACAIVFYSVCTVFLKNVFLKVRFSPTDIEVQFFNRSYLVNVNNVKEINFTSDYALIILKNGIRLRIPTQMENYDELKARLMRMFEGFF